MVERLTISRAVVEKVRAALEALCAQLPLPTAGNYQGAEIHEKEDSFTCPMCDGDGEVEGEQFINFDGHALNVLFSGIGDEHLKWQKLFDAFVKLAPQLQTLSTALNEAIAPENVNAEMRSAKEWGLDFCDLLQTCQKGPREDGPILTAEKCVQFFERIQQDAIAAQPVKAGKSAEEWAEEIIRQLTTVPLGKREILDALVTRIQADARSTPPEPRNGWQPIASAPKDGTWILIWWRGSLPRMCSWVNGKWYEQPGSSFAYCVPTHWQLLPCAPDGEVTK